MDEPGSHLEARGRRGWPRADRTLQRAELATPAPAADWPQRLQRLGLADETQPGAWAVHADAEKTLRALGERGDIIRTMQRAMSGKPRELAVFEPGDNGRTILGRVAAKGWPTNRDRGYLVIDGVDGKAHYVALNARDELANTRPGPWWR